jgi:hypothetical protein
MGSCPGYCSDRANVFEPRQEATQPTVTIHFIFMATINSVAFPCRDSLAWFVVDQQLFNEVCAQTTVVFAGTDTFCQIEFERERDQCDPLHRHLSMTDPIATGWGGRRVGLSPRHPM